MTAIKYLLLVCLLPISAMHVHAQESSDVKKQLVKPDRGYWYYEEPPVKNKKKDKKAKPQITERQPLPPLPPYKKLLKAHPADLKKIFKERLDEVVWQATPQNMYAFMLVKDVVRRKALAVAQMHSYMLLQNPQLNMNTIRAVKTFTRDTEVRAKMKAINSTLARNRSSYALIYFRSDTCIYCLEQDNALKFFRMKTGWKVKIVNIDRKKALARKLNITMTPTIILIKKGTDDYMPVGVGATAADELSLNIYRAVRLMNGETTAEQYFMYDFDKGGLMDPTADPTLNSAKLEVNPYE